MKYASTHKTCQQYCLSFPINSISHYRWFFNILGKSLHILYWVIDFFPKGIGKALCWSLRRNKRRTVWEIKNAILPCVFVVIRFKSCRSPFFRGTDLFDRLWKFGVKKSPEALWLLVFSGMDLFWLPVMKLTPNFNTIILSGAFALKEKFHRETFLFYVRFISSL